MGYREITLTDEEMSTFYSSPKDFCTQFQLKQNEYLLIKNSGGTIVDKFCFQNNFLRDIKFPIIENKFCGTIKPKNPYQYLAIDLLQDEAVPVKVIRGVYGSGKDHLMFNEALSLIEKGSYNKIIYIRPNVTVANVPEIGYLKGDIEDKLNWTLGPLVDKVGGQDNITRLINNEQLEMAPLLYIRGRSFDNSIIYVSEGQNMTVEIVKLLISRVGANSTLWINGDTHQTDKRVYAEDNGITKMIEKLAGNEYFGYVYLPITERGPIANLANLLD